MSQRRYELSDYEWSIIEPLLPNKPRGVPRADDWKILNGIYWRLRTGSPCVDIKERYGPLTACYNRFVRWRRIGVWDRLFEAVSAGYDGDCVFRVIVGSDFAKSGSLADGFYRVIRCRSGRGFSMSS